MGNTKVTIGTYEFHLQERTCTRFSCTNWQITNNRLFDFYVRTKGYDFELHQLERSGPIVLKLGGATGEKIYHQTVGNATACGPIGESGYCLLQEFERYGANHFSRELQVRFPNGERRPLLANGVITNHCLRFSSGSLKENPGSNGAWLEREYVIFGQF